LAIISLLEGLIMKAAILVILALFAGSALAWPSDPNRSDSWVRKLDNVRDPCVGSEVLNSRTTLNADGSLRMDYIEAYCRDSSGNIWATIVIDGANNGQFLTPLKDLPAPFSTDWVPIPREILAGIDSTPPIPEPGTIGLLILGLGAVAIASRGRRGHYPPADGKVNW
jgi:hypothetical protein